MTVSYSSSSPVCSGSRRPATRCRTLARSDNRSPNLVLPNPPVASWKKAWHWSLTAMWMNHSCSSWFFLPFRKIRKDRELLAKTQELSALRASSLLYALHLHYTHVNICEAYHIAWLCICLAASPFCSNSSQAADFPLLGLSILVTQFFRLNNWNSCQAINWSS